MQDFIQQKFKPDYEISFERVHRMGKRPRNIVAKFTFFKDREFTRTRAPRKLNGSRVWINEQYPPEIEDKRKKLYPIMRKTKKDGKNVKLGRDTLFFHGDANGSAP